MIGKDLKTLIKSKKMVLNGLNVNLNQAYERYNELDYKINQLEKDDSGNFELQQLYDKINEVDFEIKDLEKKIEDLINEIKNLEKKLEPEREL